MAIEVAQINGDTVELLFSPDEDDLHVGENLSVVERRKDRGLIVQIIELRATSLPLIVPSLSRRDRDPLESTSPAMATAASRPPRSRKPRLPARPVTHRHLAIAKIRKLADPTWQPWNGWIPMRDVMVFRTADQEMLRQCVPNAGNSVRLGKTLAGDDFDIEGGLLETINLIAGTQGAGASHLAKLIVDELIDCGAPCVVFDTKGAYTLASRDRQSLPATGEEHSRLVHLVPGESLKLGIQHFGAAAFVALLTRFGLPMAAAMYFESHVGRRLACAKQQEDPAQPPAFLGIDDVLCLAQDLESGGQTVMGGAILSCLEMIRQTQVVATHPDEATAFWDGYAQIRDGGALIIDLSRLTTRARPGLIHALVSLLSTIYAQEIATGVNDPPFMFFDDAQPLVSRRLLADVLTPARQLGLTCFFVTEMISGLDDSLLRQAQNLFIRRLASADEARYLARSHLVDPETLQTLAQRLPEHHSLLVGDATGGYPIIFTADAFSGVRMTPARSEFFHAASTAMVQAETSRQARPRRWRRAQAPAEAAPTLPLFPDDTPPRAVDLGSHGHRLGAETSPSPSLSIAQVTATWDLIVKRLARRRRSLESLLSTARPLRIAGARLVLGFPPQQRFQQELVASEEYRHLLEEELKQTYGMSLEVTTEIHPA
jgi:hypothetical protein